MTTALLLIFLAGVAEFFKDLSEEGKLSGYWDKHHRPQFFWPVQPTQWVDAYVPYELEYWWRVHWLQGPKWDWLPVWIRQYLAFRDGWHLLKFFSLNLFAVGVVLLAGLPWWWYFIIRTLFSAPETVGRIIYNKVK